MDLLWKIRNPKQDPLSKLIDSNFLHGELAFALRVDLGSKTLTGIVQIHGRDIETMLERLQCGAENPIQVLIHMYEYLIVENSNRLKEVDMFLKRREKSFFALTKSTIQDDGPWKERIETHQDTLVGIRRAVAELPIADVIQLGQGCREVVNLIRKHKLIQLDPDRLDESLAILDAHCIRLQTRQRRRMEKVTEELQKVGT